MGGITDKGARSLGSSRRVRPVGEPIYCPAPSPLSPDDIICPGSDDEIDEAAKAAKQLRYEGYGRRYLEGRPIRILSASLRGPFDKPSGWQNPWLPKLSSGQYCLNNSNQPLEASSVFQYGGDIPAVVLLNRGDKDSIAPNPDDSIDCHLPSPRSHEDLQFLGSPSHFQGRSRIRSWAEQVQEVISEEDHFWAPGHDLLSSGVNASNKRPAGREWLKRRPTKKKRYDASQSSGMASTPTPTPTSLLRRSRRAADAGKGPANRSFEIKTPSSSPDQGLKESLDAAKDVRESLHGEDRQSVPPAATTTSSWKRPRLPSWSETEQAEAQQQGDKRKSEASSKMSQQHLQRRSSHGNSRCPETIEFQDHVDDSFCYRTRSLNHVVAPTTSNTIAADCTRTPTASKYGISDIVPINSDTRELESNQNRNVTSAKHTQRSERSNDCSGSTSTDADADDPKTTIIEMESNLSEHHEVVLQDCNMANTGVATSSSFGMNISQPLGDIASNESNHNPNIPSIVPAPILDVKDLQTTRPEPLLDKGSTLIGDPMNTEQPGDVQSTQPISATKPANFGKLTPDGNFKHQKEAQNVNDATDFVSVTTLQHEMAESHSERNQPPQQSSQGSTTNLAIESNAFEGQVGTMNEDHVIPTTQQSPWVPVCAPDAGVKPSSDSIGRDEGEHTTSPTSRVVPLLELPAPMHHSPTIRLSQQSPWAPDFIESSNSNKRVAAMPMSPIVTVNTELPENHEDQLSPVNQDPTSCPGSSPAILPGPDISSREPREHQHLGSDAVVGEERTIPQIPSSPRTPVSQIARKPTLDGEVSIRSFFNFNGSSPPGSIPNPDTSVNRSILSSGKDRISTNSTRRVSFAPLPHEQGDDSSQPPTNSRAASPPPPMPVDLDGEDIGGKYQKHFSVMNQRFSVHSVRKPHFQQRLLPSASQQKPASPPVDAMAKVFRDADASRLNRAVDVVQSTRTQEKSKDRIEEVDDIPQTPWRPDSQAADDVAAVIGHLDDFLDVWDVNTEMARNRAELDGDDKH
ncbi:hypothetical protein GGR50DRAFT_638534 [Xylaria sp. CBS 124048]|nr:hypothetical protein GGR50DRAFT_638534 [Xylaria sp. CBS 124048]